jgi:hypothetical protein
MLQAKQLKIGWANFCTKVNGLLLCLSRNRPLSLAVDAVSGKTLSGKNSR